MALKGTLKDFGIADILQLIGQQQKTGILSLTNKGESVNVSFKDGNIVRAESTSRNRKDLIGTMLVAANLITESQLEFALETQKRTLQRLGDVLVGQGSIGAEKFKSMVALQTSETLYKLFSWKSGTYAFEVHEIEVDGAFPPLRAESVLMEGFRRVDEWPVVKKRITSDAMTFEKVKELPPPALEKDDFDSALDDAFAEEKKEINKGEFQSVGDNERRVYELIGPGRTVSRIIELSMLGEFETSKALCNLINLEYARGVAASGEAEASGKPSRLKSALQALGRISVSMLVVGALLVVFTRVDFGAFRLGSSGGTTYTDPAAQRFAAVTQMSRLTTALEVYRLEKGQLPDSLGQLVEAGIVTADDVRYPWRDDYYYRRDGATYVLLPPLR
ncbi:MAG: DUF4388 domain-containing protein [Myxococcaceae bacterium]|jgi:hypothetical protein|nr:DUF4388 domain-containing protein [Myxococcaceae bacterium]